MPLFAPPLTSVEHFRDLAEVAMGVMTNCTGGPPIESGSGGGENVCADAGAMPRDFRLELL